MDLNEYQGRAKETARYDNPELPGVVYTTLGLAGEAGECANVVKKMFRDGHTIERRFALFEEMGDTLWYLAALATEMGWSLESVAQQNLDKLRGRYDVRPWRGGVE